MVKHKHAFIFVLLLICNCSKIIYIPFKPVCIKCEKYIYCNEKITEPFYSNIIFVLKFYNENYKIDKNGVIHISRTLSFDRELLFNYTKKAKDVKWLREHKK